ncbi:IS110 family transposase, partial [Mesorhizobium sp. M00.F.Ca.ET.149.01.1.1]
IVAVTFVSEVGDVRRFDNPRQLMAFLGLVPSERSTGDTVKRGGLTLAGNRRARRVRLEGLPKAVREIAWKAQTRLCARYRRLMAAGKKKPIVVAAIA